MPEETPLRDTVVEYCATKLADSFGTIVNSLKLLNGDQIWRRPNDVSNSIGVLVLHLTGNLSQWINRTFGGDTYERNRPAEFAQRNPLPTEQILSGLESAVGRAGAVIRGLTVDQLTQPVTVQGYHVSGAGAVIHAVEHFSLHTGQIVYAAKLLLHCELSAYDAQGRRNDGRIETVP